MKRNKIIIGSAGIIAIAAIFAVSPWTFNGSQGNYEQKEISSLKAKSAEDAKKWIEARYIDQETGLPITPEKLALIEKQLRKNPRNKNLSFIEQGPDNIGGRTRAIQIDRTNINRIWAGGVSGDAGTGPARAPLFGATPALPPDFGQGEPLCPR